MVSFSSFTGEGSALSDVTSPPELSASAQLSIDQALGSLHERAGRWARLSPDTYVTILEHLIDGLLESSPRWVAAALEAKGLPAGGQAEGEEWISMFIGLRQLRLLRHSLIDIERHGHPRLLAPLQRRPNGQVVAQVYPEDVYERMIMPGITAEVWMQPGYGLEETLAEQAWAYREPPKGRVAAVLGAGNNAVLVITDALYQLFVERRVVALKLSPVNDYLSPLLSEAFAALIEPGYLRLLHGGAAEGGYLVNHPLVDAVHMTGSDRTYNAIMFGSGPEAAARKAAGERLLHKPFTAELGSVTPVFVVPGPWSQRDVQQQARALGTWAALNAGLLCFAPRLLVQQRQWPQREAFLAAYGKVMDQELPRPARYPGASEYYRRALAAHPNALRFGKEDPETLPWTLVRDLDPAAVGEICFKEELFCSVMAETALDAADAVAYLEQAVQLANEQLWGTLSAAFIVHPATLHDSRVAAAFDEALASLRYGTIVVNSHPGYSFYAMSTVWGAFPGSTVRDVQSGMGMTNNVYMFRHPEKSLLRAPFHPLVSPLNLGSHSMPAIARHMAELQAHRSLAALARVTFSASRSLG